MEPSDVCCCGDDCQLRSTVERVQESGTGVHNKGLAYRVMDMLISSDRGSGVRSPRHGARMPDGQPWVVRMGSHPELSACNEERLDGED